MKCTNSSMNFCNLVKKTGKKKNFYQNYLKKGECGQTYMEFDGCNDGYYGHTINISKLR